MTALIFDLDGVVADTSAAHYRSWQKLANDEGVAFDPTANEALLGRTREESFDIFLQGRVLQPSDRAAWLARKQACFLHELAKMGPQDALPGVVALLDEAALAGLPIGLASSSRNAHGVLAQLRLTDRFSAIADGSTVARAKPEPDVFLWVAERLGHPAAQCLVFEDSPSGYAAALAGGFPCITLGDAVRGTLHYRSLAGVTLSELLARAGLA